jgi:hypothetical protein
VDLRYLFRYFSALKCVKGANIDNVGNYAFLGCTRLETVTLSSAQDIGSYAFRYCTGLTGIILGDVPPAFAGSNTFIDTGGGVSPCILIHVPAGAVGNYTSDAPPGWNASANTGPNGNTSVYGSNHNRIEITDL